MKSLLDSVKKKPASLLVVFTFKRFFDASFFIFDVSPPIRKTSSTIISAHSKRFWKCEKIYKELKMQNIFSHFEKRLECSLVISEEAFRMEGETSKIKKLASVERLNLNMSDPMNGNLSSIFIYLLGPWERHLAGFSHFGEEDRWLATPK